MKILVCSDGSDQAEKAVRFGAAVAAACKAEVTLLGIVETPGKSGDLMASLKRSQTLLQDRKLSVEMISKSGAPLEEITRRTREAEYDLVVVGAVPKESRGLFWMSSKTYKIIKEIRPPVLAVAGKIASIKKILICSGGKSCIHTAVELAGRIAQGTQAQTTLLHVLPERPLIYAHLPRMEETAAYILDSPSELGVNLRREKETLKAMGVAVAVRVRTGPVLEQILAEAHDGEYDLVVTGSSLGRGLRTYVLGDITREIVNRVHRAVLVVRGTDAGPSSKFPLRDWFAAHK